MPQKILFKSNYNDLCKDDGFQFEFYCEHCQNTFRSEFKRYNTGAVAGVLSTAASLFGGILGKASEIGDRVRDAGWQKARDEAFDEASEEVFAKFKQCPRCNKIVCVERCWNEKRGLCKECAPDLGVEMSAAQASRSVEEVWAHAAMAEEDKRLGKEHWRETIVATCPECGAPQETNARFCASCGAKLKSDEKCANCGEKLAPNALFCPACGTKR